MIGVAIPVHNEQERIGPCLASVLRASLHPALQGEAVCIVVVLDNCSDGSARIVQQFPTVAIHECQAYNVGVARAAGAMHLLQAGARWLAFTDADTLVSEQWLAAQLSLKTEAVCGTVSINDWGIYGNAADIVRRKFMAAYQDSDGHRHVHGANLGLSAEAYRKVGGFSPLACSEDQALVDALVSADIPIAWSSLPRVFTSARYDARARGGFGDYLLNIAQCLGQGSAQHPTDSIVAGHCEPGPTSY